MESGKINVYNIEGSITGSVELDANLLTDAPNKHVVFEQVVAENAALRQGTHSTLTKSEVRGGGRKPRPQKHTGNARQGSTRNPHWPGGGVAFGPKPTRNYNLYLNTKAHALAFKSAITLKNNDHLISAIEVSLAKPNTKSFAKLFDKLGYTKSVLLISDNEQILKSARNIVKVVAKKTNSVSVRDIINGANILIDKTAISTLAKGHKE